MELSSPPRTAWASTGSGRASRLVSDRPVIVTGTPWSGASVVAQALANAGVTLGARFRKMGRLSAAGALIDEEVAGFHDRLLAAAGMRLEDPSSLNGFVPPPEWEARGVRLVEHLFADRGAWGFKEARATLFLEFWDRVLPDARWVFVVRRPEQVAWSLLLDAAAPDRARTAVGRVRAGLHLWTAFAERIARFASDRPDRVRVLVAPDDFSPAGFRALESLVRDAEPDITGAFNPRLLRTRQPRWLRTLAWSHAPSRRAWDDLVRVRAETTPDTQGPRPAPPTTTADRPVVCLVTRRRFATSETFIQAHLNLLPADVRWIYGSSTTEPRAQDDLALASGRERIARALYQEFGLDTEPLRVRALRRYLRREGVRAVLAEFGPVGTLVSRACAEEGVPLVVHFHGYDAHKTSVLEEYRERYRDMFATAAAVVGVSDEMMEQLAALGVPRSKLVLNPCGVDTDRFSGADPAAAPPRFLAVGRFVEKKAPHLTLLAFREVLAACPDARLVMIGDGELRGTCQQLARGLGLDEAVSFLGYQPHDEVLAWMRRSRGFVQHSIRASDGNCEGTPVAVVEAGACGLPVVATSHAGIKRVIVDGTTGFLVPEQDVHGMARRMIELARDPARAAAMGREARQRVDGHFSMDRSIERLWRAIESVLVDA